VMNLSDPSCRKEFNSQRFVFVVTSVDMKRNAVSVRIEAKFQNRVMVCGPELCDPGMLGAMVSPAG
jgi:hypothetical protein